MTTSPESKRTATITPREEGFTLDAPGESLRVEWVHVAEIAAYRRDPEGKDLLCLAFRLGHAEQYVEVHEEMTGYESLLPHLYEAFPEISPAWWQDVTTGLGPNRVTLYGLPAADGEQPSPAERYLQQIHQRKTVTKGQWMRVGWACAGVWAAAGVQTFLVGWLSGWNKLAAMSVLPLSLVIFVARRVGKPGVFFLLLLGFHLAEALWIVVLGRWPGGLIGSLVERRLSYLLLPGVEILLGMGVMLLPNRRAAGVKLR
ncbi:MAG: hypothetical protein JXA11_04875 [Phycisphaerae bacterium]|nr:hypothetical protein [Phycisphaerae bacterium]